MLESDFLQADIKVRNHPDFVELSTSTVTVAPLYLCHITKPFSHSCSD